MTDNKTPWFAHSFFGTPSVSREQRFADGTPSGVLEGIARCGSLENAETIAKALNSHDALVAALRPLQVWAENERRGHSAREEENEAEYMGTLADNAKAALALAGGNPPTPKA